MQRTILPLMCLAVLAGAIPLHAASFRDDIPFWTGSPGIAEFQKAEIARLEAAREKVAEVKAVEGERTIGNTLRPYDEAYFHLGTALRQAGLIANVHPDSAMRDTAEALQQMLSSYATSLSLDPELYEAIAAVNLENADAATRYYVTRELRDFRLSGVDRDRATREKVKALRDDLVLITQAFGRNIRTDKSSITVSGADELEGLPADYIENHPPGEDGTIVLTTEYPDAFPVFSYAKDEDVRQRMYMAYTNRAYPANMDVLDRMIEKRHELATLLGFDQYADLATADRMAGDAATASAFIDRIVAAAKPIGAREYAQLLARKRQGEPDASVVDAWDRSYYSELVRKSDYDFDSRSVRPYFPYERVKEGVLDVTARLFGVEFRRVENAPVWHPSVECYELYDNGTLRGRFYLDMHPRPNKYSHAAHFGIRSGIAGRALPEAALVCNFPGGEEGDPGLMEHGQVETFFHEFGHLLHNMFAGHGEWNGVSGISTERDFSEAPSQLLEEWAWDPAVLATFAKHYETNEPIPAGLVARMKRADEFGKGLSTLRQMVFARLSLAIYNRDPASVNTDAMVEKITADYVPFPYVEDTHFQASFGHLAGYSAAYYTYMWSLVIAKDLFSAFDHEHMFEPTVAKRYREEVLAPGGSKPAAKLIQDFLGRPFSSDAWERWLKSEEQTSSRIEH